jgi:hypothetical protein
VKAPDPFADDPIERDGYGRAKIIPVGRGGKPNLKAKPVPYTRVSTYADALSDAGGLVKWSKWHLALGLGRNPDLAALAGTYGPTVDDLSRRDKQELDSIIDRAHDRSGGNVKADYGTAVHAYTEPDAQNVPDPFDGDATAEDERLRAELMASIAADSAAYLAALDLYGLETVETEQFVVNDELQAAGTFDHTVRLARDLVFDDVTIPAGTVLVLDKKTGKLHLDTQCVQLAVYANAKRYDPETGERAPLDVSTDYAILAHTPKGTARCDLYLIDIRIGWAAAKVAGKVREHRVRKDIGRAFPTVEPTEPVAPALHIPAPALVIDGNEVVVTTYTPLDPAILETVKYGSAIMPERVAEWQCNTQPESSIDFEGEALATVAEIFPGATAATSRLDKLNTAKSRDALSAVWAARATDGEGDWTDEHTAALRARAKELEKAA